MDEGNVRRSIRNDDLCTRGNFDTRGQQHHASYDHSCDALLKFHDAPGRIAFLNGGEPRFFDFHEMIQHLES